MSEADATNVAPSRVRGALSICCRWLLPALIVLIAVVWVALPSLDDYFEAQDEESMQDQIINQKRQENPITPPAGCSPQCDSFPSPLAQHHCHIAEATRRYEEWRMEMEANEPNSAKYQALLTPRSNSFAYHVESAIDILTLDSRVKDAAVFRMQFNFSVWAARLQIETADPRDNKRFWLPLLYEYIEAPAVIRSTLSKVRNPVKFAKDWTPPTNDEISLAIRHYMNLAAALCEPKLQLPHSQSLEQLHESAMNMFIDKRQGRLYPWKNIPPDPAASALRAALEMWVRAELLRLGVPLDEIVDLDFRNYRLEVATVSSDKLRHDLEPYGARVPSCLFRPARNSGAKSNGQLLLGPSVKIVAQQELDGHQSLVLSEFDWKIQSGQKLARAENRQSNQVGTLQFIRVKSGRSKPRRDDLKITGEENRTVEWSVPSSADSLSVQVDLELHSGSFQLKFSIDSLQNKQLAVGFLLAWKSWPDWGLPGYLGSSTSAWAYDPFTGDIVFDRESIAGSLPTINPLASVDAGTITVQFDLPRGSYGRAQFIINGKRTPAFLLPKSAVVVPGVSMFKQGQRVRLLSLSQQPVSDETSKQIEEEAKRLRTMWDATPTSKRPSRDLSRWD